MKIKKIKKTIRSSKVTKRTKKVLVVPEEVIAVSNIKVEEYSSLKMAGVLLALLMLFTGISSVGSTVSYFNDIETSIGNLLRAGSLDFSVVLSDPLSSNIKLTAGAQAVTVIPSVTGGVGDFPLAYKVRIERTGGTSPAFCDAIDLQASSTPFTYSGKLMNFVEGTTTSLAPLELNLSLPANSGFNITDSCLVDVIYSGWVNGQSEGVEYHDEERVSLVIFDPPAVVVPVAESISGFNPEPEVVQDGGEEKSDEPLPLLEDIETPPVLESESDTVTDVVIEEPKETTPEPESEVVVEKVPEPVVESVPEETPKVEETVVENVNPPVESSST